MNSATESPAKPLRIRYLNDGDESPLLNHHPLEIAVCDETRTFYVFGLFARTYGTAAVESGCQKYAREHWGMN